MSHNITTSTPTKERRRWLCKLAWSIAVLMVLCFLVFPTTTLAIPQTSVTKPLVVVLRAGVTAAEIQKALDSLPADGGEVVLPPGKIEVSQPIILQRDYQTLRGAGRETILFLADNANCPVIIMGEPVNQPKPTRHLRVGDLFIDGNRLRQQRELWRLEGEGSIIRNNGIAVQNVSDSIIENVTCAHCRSGGLARIFHQTDELNFAAAKVGKEMPMTV